MPLHFFECDVSSRGPAYSVLAFLQFGLYAEAPGIYLIYYSLLAFTFGGCLFSCCLLAVEFQELVEFNVPFLPFHVYWQGGFQVTRFQIFVSVEVCRHFHLQQFYASLVHLVESVVERLWQW